MTSLHVGSRSTELRWFCCSPMCRSGSKAVSSPLYACPVHGTCRWPLRAQARRAYRKVARLGALGQRRRGQARWVRMLLVTGGAGFLRSHLVAPPKEGGPTHIVGKHTPR